MTSACLSTSSKVSEYMPGLANLQHLAIGPDKQGTYLPLADSFWVHGRHDTTLMLTSDKHLVNIMSKALLAISWLTVLTAYSCHAHLVPIFWER